MKVMGSNPGYLLKSFLLYKKIPGEFVVVHVQNSQEAVSGKNSTMDFTDIVVGDIEP